MPCSSGSQDSRRVASRRLRLSGGYRRIPLLYPLLSARGRLQLLHLLLYKRKGTAARANTKQANAACPHKEKARAGAISRDKLLQSERQGDSAASPCLSCYPGALLFNGKINFGYIFTGRNVVIAAFNVQLKGRTGNGISFSFNPFHQRRIARRIMLKGRHGQER